MIALPQWRAAVHPAAKAAVSIARAGLVAAGASCCVTPAVANFGYCYTNGLMGGTKVFIHESVREANFWDGAVVDAYRADLENSHRFRFGALSCPSFDSEAEAKDDFMATRMQFLAQGFAEFVFPVRRD